MTLRNDQASGVLLLVLAMFLGWQNRAYPLGSLQDPGPGYTPLLIAVFLGVTGAVIAIRGRTSPRLAEVKWPEARRAALILLACAVATWALEPIGYRLTMMGLMVFFVGFVERRKPFAVVAVAVGFSLVTYYVIGTLLRVPLPTGPGGF
jgi:hypothetical protein